MKQKVLVISQHFPPEIGAASQRMNYISDFLHQLGYQVTVLTSEPCYPNKSLYKDYYNGRTVSYPFQMKRIRSKENYSKEKLARIRKYISFMIRSFMAIWRDKGNYDFVISTSPPIFVGLIGIFAKVRFKSKLFLDLRDLWPESVEGLKVFKKGNLLMKLAYILEGFLYNYSDSIIINSQSFEQKIREKLKRDKDITYLPNGVSKEQLAKCKKKSDDNSVFQVTYAGNIGMAQGICTVIEAANLLRERVDIHFNIVGTGVCEEEIRVLAKKHELTNITFHGGKSKEDTMEILAKSDLALIHLIKQEVFETVIPSKLFDYMMFSLPIVAGIKGQGGKIVRESGCGLLSEPEDAKGMAKCIIETMEMDDKGKSFGERGRDFLLENFLWDDNIQKLHREFSLRRGEKHDKLI